MSDEEAIINQILNLKFKGCFVKNANGNIAKVPAPIKVAVGQLLIVSVGGRSLVFEVDEVFDVVPMEHVRDRIPYIVEDGLPEIHEMRKAQEREARQLLIKSMNQQFHERALKLSEDFVGKEVMDEVADKLNNTSWNSLIHKALFTGIRNAS